jgi:hypothetical protein
MREVKPKQKDFSLIVLVGANKVTDRGKGGS